MEIDLPEHARYGWPLRLDELAEGGKRQVKGYPGLYLVGVFYQGKGAMFNFNTEAEQAVEEIKERLKLLDGASTEPHPQTQSGIMR